MHSSNWYIDVAFAILVVVTSWQFWVIAAAAITGIVVWWKKKKS